ncbi:hypothetical protein HDU82_003391, partial [Entophlyctis luteolus]
ASSPLRGKAAASSGQSLGGTYADCTHASRAGGIFAPDPPPTAARPSRRPAPPSLMTATIQHLPVASAPSASVADNGYPSISGSTRRRLDSPLARSSLTLGYDDLPARPEASSNAARLSSPLPLPPPESFSTPAGRRTVVTPYNILSPPPPEPISAKPTESTSNGAIAYEGAPVAAPKPRPASAYANKSSVVFGEIGSAHSANLPAGGAVHRPAKRIGKWTNFSSIVIGSDTKNDRSTSSRGVPPGSQGATTAADSGTPASAVAAPATPKNRFSVDLNKSSIVFADDGSSSVNALSKSPVSRKKPVPPAINTDKRETLAEFIGHAKTAVTEAASKMIPKKDPAAIPHSAGVLSGKFKIY